MNQVYIDDRGGCNIDQADIGGVKSFYIGGISKIVSEYVDGAEIIGEASAGVAAELAMMRSGEMQLCLLTADTTYDAYYTDEEPFEELRCLFGSYPHTFIACTKDPAVSNIEEFEGQIIAVGPLGGSPDICSRAILPVLGIEPKDYLNVDLDQSFIAVSEGSAYGFSGTCGNPASAMYEAETSMDINWLRLTDDQLQAILDAYPYYSECTLDGGMYKGFNGEDYKTFGVWQCMYTTSEIDEEVVYDITKAVMEHLDILKDSSSLAANTSLEAGLAQTVPLHVGAYRYYVEMGIDVPDELIPPEAK